MRYASAAFFAALFIASFVHADKLAPPHSRLQPLPVDVQPAVSESVQRAASQTDLQTIENVQVAEENSAFENEENGGVPAVPFAPESSSDSLALWIALAIVALVAGGAAWLWRKF